MRTTQIYQWRRKDSRPVLITVSERNAELFLKKNHKKAGGIYFRKEEWSQFFTEVQPQRPTPAPLIAKPIPTPEPPATTAEPEPVVLIDTPIESWENEPEVVSEDKPKRRRRKKDDQ